MGLLQNMKFAAVEEVTPGVLVAQTADDYIKLAADAKPPGVAQKFIDNPEMSGSMSPEDPIPGPDEGGWDFSVVLKGSGTIGVAPESGVLLKNIFGIQRIPTGGTVKTGSTPTTTELICTGSNFEINDALLVDLGGGAWDSAWITDVVAGSGEQTLTLFPALPSAPSPDVNVHPAVIYKMSSLEVNHNTLSLYCYLDGVKYSLGGCIGNVAFDFKWGEVPKATFQMKLSNWVAEDAVCPDTPNYDAVKLFACTGGSFKLGSGEEYIENFSCDLGYNVAQLGAIQSNGYYKTWLNKREPKGSFDPFMNDSSFLTAYKNGTTAQSHVKIGGPSNMIMLRQPRIMYRDVKAADKEGINTYDIGYRATKTSADDEVFLAFLSNVSP